MPRLLAAVLLACLLLLLAGCCAQGLMETTEPQTPVEVATPAPETPTDDSKLASLLSEEQMKSLEIAKAELEAVASAEQFAAILRKLVTMSSDIASPLDDEYHRNQMSGIPDDIFTDYPFYSVGYAPEGMAVLVDMPFPPLHEAAKRTPEAADDRFVEVLEAMYEEATAGGYSKIEVRNWDHGGCSPLGHDVHKGILLAADAALAEGDLFAVEIQAIREPVIKDIVEENAEFFPYCDPTNFEKTLVPKMRTEVNAILAEVKLSESERADIQKALDTRLKIRPGGGGATAGPRRKGPSK